MKVFFNTGSIEDYRLFLKIKSLPRYSITGHTAEFPDEYAERIGIKTRVKSLAKYEPPSWMFDYQKAITEVAIKKQKYACFIDCGYGKTAIMFEFINHTQRELGSKKNCLIVCPLMVIRQTLSECKKFYEDSYQIQQIKAANLKEWLKTGEGIGITNFESITDDLEQGRLGCLAIDESSMMKSSYGKWGTKLIDLGKGLDWKLSLTGTPAPNDRIEYANQAVFLDQFPTVNSFLAKFFVNKGTTGERWILKPHAVEAFYKSLSHWSIFLTNPATYGWKDNCSNIPPIKVNIHDIDLTQAQHDAARMVSGDLFATTSGGITSRTVLAQLAKGKFQGKRIETLKTQYIRDLVATWEKDESTIIWCRFNAEQEYLEELFPHAASITGKTPQYKRDEMIDGFKAGRIKTIISKDSILGFGLNLQVATRQVFSTCHDSYERYYQAIKRSNRVGSTRTLNVHLPITELERPMLSNVLEKAARVQSDGEEQEQISKIFWRENNAS